MAIIIRDATTSTNEATVDSSGNLHVQTNGATTGATAPTNAVEEGLIAATALPTAVTGGQLVGAMGDKFGRQITTLNGPRDIIGTVSVQTTDNSSHNLIAGAGAGIYTDILFLVVTNESATAAVISLSDGTTTYKIAVAANGGAVLPIPTPLPAASTNTAWTVQSSVNSINLDFIAIYVKNK